MAKYRRGRINEEIQKEMTVILRKVKDPRVSDAFISITAADCTADLKYAKIYYSALSGDSKEIAKGLKTSPVASSVIVMTIFSALRRRPAHTNLREWIVPS